MTVYFKITEKGSYYLKLLSTHTREEAKRLADAAFPDLPDHSKENK